MDFWNDPLKVAADWLLGILTSWGIPNIAAQVLIGFLGVLILLSLLMVLDIFLVWVERKVVSRFQDRIGPNRVGPRGLLQPFADTLKLLTKEIIVPTASNRYLFIIAPILSIAPALAAWAVIPFDQHLVLADVNAGLLFLFAFSSLGVYGIIISG